MGEPQRKWDGPTRPTVTIRLVIRLMSSSMRGPSHIIQWTSEYTRKMVTSSLGRVVYAFSEMVGHMPMLREISAHSAAFRRLWRALRIARVFTQTSRTRRPSQKKSWFGTFSPPARPWSRRNWATFIRLQSRGIWRMDQRKPRAPRRSLESGTYNPGALRPLNAVSPRER